jgi:hypothetical protein
MQKWEYIYILRTRRIKVNKALESSRLSKWEDHLICSDGSNKTLPEDGLIDSMNELGYEGWELVTSIGTSSEYSLNYSAPFSNQNTAGLTTEERYVFKRPKE